MSASRWARVSAAMGIPFVVGFVVLGVLSGNSPDYKSSDSKILDWYASHGSSGQRYRRHLRSCHKRRLLSLVPR